MKPAGDFLTSPFGQATLVATLVLLGILIAVNQRKPKATALPVARPAPAAVLPQLLTRVGAKFTSPPTASIPPETPSPTRPQQSAPPPALPLSLFASRPEAPLPTRALIAPYGRMIPCLTVTALESNRLDTPIIGLVTEDLWHDGRRIIPAGTEVHGRALLDRTRERIAAQQQWRIVWRTTDADNGTELAVEGIVLDREFDDAENDWGEHDGSAGLRGQVVKSHDERELKLFSATFLASATAALQDNRLTGGLLVDASIPIATARNAALAGTGAILREYAQSMREAIARDGFFLRVPAGKPFYLYVTQTINRAQVTPAAQAAQVAAR